MVVLLWVLCTTLLLQRQVGWQRPHPLRHQQPANSDQDALSQEGEELPKEGGVSVCPNITHAGKDWQPCKLLASASKHAPTVPFTCSSREELKEHVYLFLIVPPRHGSSALMGLLHTSPYVSTMCDTEEGVSGRCEGTWKLVKQGLFKHKERWKPNKPEDWVQAVIVYHSSWDVSKPILVDKSPPNLMKVASISSQLQAAGLQATFLFMTRSPCFMSDHTLTLHFCNDFEYLNIMRQQHQYLLQHHVPVLHVRYEDFFLNLTSTCQRLLHFMPCLRHLDPTQHFPVLQGKRSKSIASYVQGRSLSSLLQLNATPPSIHESLKYFGYL